MLTRREFLAKGAGALLAVPLLPRLQPTPVFLHGVASGDPLQDRVILWTRVSLPEPQPLAAVVWRVALDPGLRQVVDQGTAITGRFRDFTVKAEARGLAPGTTYYYQFEALGQSSPVGRTRTLPMGAVSRLRLAVVTCSNYPLGYFNAYDLIARRRDLDAVLHLGDYIYESRGSSELGREHVPYREVLSLDDYRLRHAQYKADPQLQRAHRVHPFITVWDDHESSNDSWFGGAEGHDPEDGDWFERKAAALQAYYEWMPIRPSFPGNPYRSFRHFPFGDLADLIMLDTRLWGRDQQASSPRDVETINDPTRSILGADQEDWLAGELFASQQRGTTWRLLGQQVMMGQLMIPPAEDLAPEQAARFLDLQAARGDSPIPAGRDAIVLNVDQWDGYGPSRQRVLEHLIASDIDNLVVLSGDFHASFGQELSLDPFDPEVYDPATSRGSLGVEFVVPPISSAFLPSPILARPAERVLLATQPHLRFVNLDRRGYLLLDVDAGRVQAEWYFARRVDRPSRQEDLGGAWQVRAGASRLEPVAEPGLLPGETNLP